MSAWVQGCKYTLRPTHTHTHTVRHNANTQSKKHDIHTHTGKQAMEHTHRYGTADIPSVSLHLLLRFLQKKKSVFTYINAKTNAAFRDVSKVSLAS